MSENPDTPEVRLEQFCKALEANDMTLFPVAYMTENASPFIADIREVMAKAAAAP